jgi:phosphoribosylaminoimidazole-succinocarboxamide synthase
LLSHRYEKTQAIHGLAQPAGLRRCERLPEPIYTPSTKAELGDKDINISPDEARKIVGDKYASRIEELALACYKAGAAYAEERGIIIVRRALTLSNSSLDLSLPRTDLLTFSPQADTKFEFGLDEETDEIYLVDEVLT